MGKKCGRCTTRYCGPACQEQHWKEGGHDKLCKKIKKGGGAEQYHANDKYAQAVIVAVEKCAEDTKGQTCYICTEDLHWKTKEGLVRGCSCRGTAGFLHVSCLAEQAKILREEAEENNLGAKARSARWLRWHMCSLCEQNYHGVVRCARGWACWKTYLGRPETNDIRSMAMTELGNGLFVTDHHADALSVREAELSMLRRVGGSEHNILVVQSNIASTYYMMERRGEALRLRRDVYARILKLYGEEHEETLIDASNYAMNLLGLKRFEEAKKLLRKVMPVAQRVLGRDHERTLSLREDFARAMLQGDSSPVEKRNALLMLEDTLGVMRHVLGPSHPECLRVQGELDSYHWDSPSTA